MTNITYFTVYYLIPQTEKVDEHFTDFRLYNLNSEDVRHIVTEEVYVLILM